MKFRSSLMALVFALGFLAAGCDTEKSDYSGLMILLGLNKPMYTVTFDSQSGSAVAAQSVRKGGLVAAPADPARSGFTFAGWYTEAGYVTKWVFASDTVTGDMTLFAKWQVTVTFDSQGGSTVASKLVDQDATINEPLPPTRTNYLFAGWYTEAGYVTKWVFASDTVSTETTLFAKWVTPTNYYVDSAAGSDSNGGLSSGAGNAFKTITHAAATAGTYATIHVAPGTYDVANGEVFPVTLLEGQHLVGDIANKGDAATDTAIICTNNSATTTGSANSIIIPANNTSIRGFAFNNSVSRNFVYAVYADSSIAVEVSDCTFNSNLYGAIYFMGIMLTSENNYFNIASYGYYIRSYVSLTALINNNTVGTSSSLPVDYYALKDDVTISNNTITGNGQVGMQIMGGSPLIQGNTFNRTAGYTYGAILCTQSTPKIRSNIFSCANGVRVGLNSGSTANPDLGTSSDHGSNDFSSVTSYAIMLDNNATAVNVYAIGNTWPSGHITPTTTDIQVTNNGERVWYGTGVSDFIMAP